MLEGRPHRYEPIQMPAVPSEARRFPLRRRVSPVPRTAQAQPGQRIGGEGNGREATVLAGAVAGVVHPICGELV